MTDGVPKATGNAYLAKASLPSTYADFKAAIEAGTQGLDLNFNSAGWAVIGTLLSKAKLLPDTVRDALGLTGDASVADALGVLADAKKHWWKRRANLSYFQIALADAVQKYVNGSYVSPNNTVEYSDTILLDPAGQPYFSVSQTKTMTWDGTGENAPGKQPEVLIGRYWRIISGQHKNLLEYWFTPSNATIVGVGGVTLYQFPAQRVGSVYVESGVGEWGYVASVSRNAYQDYGIANGYEYEYLGTPAQNAIDAPKFETVSWIGAGAANSAENPFTLTFSFPPRLVFIFCRGKNIPMHPLDYPYSSSIFLPFETSLFPIAANELDARYCIYRVIDSSTYTAIKRSQDGKSLMFFCSNGGTSYIPDSAASRYKAVAIG